MCKEKDRKRETEKAFDAFVKQTIFDEGNRLREKGGLPPITREELDSLEGFDAPEDGETPDQ